jgi:hypothetical protein
VKKILSLGGGVQSSCLIYLNVKGVIELDYAVFADTGAEPEYVYQHIEYLKTIARIPIYTVRAKIDLIADLERGKMQMPALINGGKGRLSKHCSMDYKIRPIYKFIKERENYKRGDKYEMVIGISSDEQQRARLTPPPFVNSYPLIFDLQMNRAACIAYAENNGFNIPKKSGCVCCPYATKANADVPYSEIDRVLNDRIETLARAIRPDAVLNRYINQPDAPPLPSLFECSGYCLT